MLPHRGVAEGAPKLAIASTSWKSMFQQERQDTAYAVFIADLHRRLAGTAVPVRFEQGRHPVLYWRVLPPSRGSRSPASC